MAARSEQSRAAAAPGDSGRLGLPAAVLVALGGIGAGDQLLVVADGAAATVTLCAAGLAVHRLDLTLRPIAAPAASTQEVAA